jgi:hypothetical protein
MLSFSAEHQQQMRPVCFCGRTGRSAFVCVTGRKRRSQKTKKHNKPRAGDKDHFPRCVVIRRHKPLVLPKGNTFRGLLGRLGLSSSAGSTTPTFWADEWNSCSPATSNWGLSLSKWREASPTASSTFLVSAKFSSFWTSRVLVGAPAIESGIAECPPSCS